MGIWTEHIGWQVSDFVLDLFQGKVINLCSNIFETIKMSNWYVLVPFTIPFTYNGYLNHTLLQHNYRGLLQSPLPFVFNKNKNVI